MKTDYYPLLLLFLFIISGCSQLSPLPDTGKAGVHTKTTVSPAAVFIAERIHEFEAVRAGTVISHDFIVKNTGGRALTLTRISAG